MDRKKSNVAQLWKQYKTENDLRSRDELVNIYAPLVKIVAGRLAMHMPSNVELDDLEGYGAFGLLDAVEKFDPNREIKFETYASTRIRGSIIDGLRSADWVPRSVRNKARRLENSTQELIQTLGRNPTDQEIAASLEVTMDDYYNILDQVRGTALLSLDEMVASDSSDDQVRLGDLVADDQTDVDRNFLHTEDVAELTEAIEQLSEREKLVLSVYYHDELTLKEIGHVLGVSESRVSQIHTKAILTLRSKLKWL